MHRSHRFGKPDNPPSPDVQLDLDDYRDRWFDVAGSGQLGSVADRQLVALGDALGVPVDVTGIARDEQAGRFDADGTSLLLDDLARRIHALCAARLRASVYYEVPSMFFAEIIQGFWDRTDEPYQRLVDIHVESLRSVLLRIDPALGSATASTAIYDRAGIPLVEPEPDYDDW